MKRKIIISALLIMILSVGAVSAATNWGKFEGFNIVKLVINGKEAKVQDVPAVMLNGRTMVPIYMLREAGLNVSWDGQKSTVTVKSNQPSSNEEVKKMVFIMDYYNTLANIGDSLGDNASALVTALTGITNFNSRESLDRAYDYLNGRIEHYNYTVDTFDQATTFSKSDQDTIHSILNTYYNSIEVHKNVLGYLEELYNKPTSITLVNKIYDELEDSNIDLDVSRDKSMTKYYEYRDKVLY